MIIIMYCTYRHNVIALGLTRAIITYGPLLIHLTPDWPFIFVLIFNPANKSQLVFHLPKEPSVNSRDQNLDYLEAELLKLFIMQT